MVLGKLEAKIKNEIRIFPNTIHKNKLKLESKYKTRYYKTLIGKHRHNTLDVKCSNIFSNLSPRVMEIKTKTNGI